MPSRNRAIGEGGAGQVCSEGIGRRSKDIGTKRHRISGLSSRATCLGDGDTLERPGEMAARVSARATEIYMRTGDRMILDEIERMTFRQERRTR